MSPIRNREMDGENRLGKGELFGSKHIGMLVQLRIYN
jgi:hypothetical protein